MTIGVLASCNRISDGTLSGIIKAAGEQGYLVTVCGQDPLENPDGTARHIESLLSRGVSGLLWEPLSRELPGSDLLQEAGIPCLTFGCFPGITSAFPMTPWDAKPPKNSWNWVIKKSPAWLLPRGNWLILQRDIKHASLNTISLWTAICFFLP